MANCNPRDLLILAAIYYIIVSYAIYLSNITRLDIAYITGQLARIMAKPNTNYFLIAKGLLRYLKSIATAKITYKPILDLRDDYIV
jgi:hypothetical protein